MKSDFMEQTVDKAKKMAGAFLSPPAILKRVFELKNSEFRCEIKF